MAKCILQCKLKHDPKYYVFEKPGKVSYCSKCREMSNPVLPEQDMLYYIMD